jgi:D-glycero-D-manno-heptose 1,7-bisphosphate phosphatase
MAGDIPRAVLLDRDGVINEDRPRSVRSVHDFVLLPHVAEAIATLTRHGYLVIVITNQAVVGRGDLALETLEAIHDRMRSLIARAGGRIDAVHVCPHTERDGCACRKPQPGLLLEAQRTYGFDLAETWFVGDALRDIQAAEAAGCRSALVLTGKGSRYSNTVGLTVFNDLSQFVRRLCDTTHQPRRNR